MIVAARMVRERKRTKRKGRGHIPRSLLPQGLFGGSFLYGLEGIHGCRFDIYMVISAYGVEACVIREVSCAAHRDFTCCSVSLHLISRSSSSSNNNAEDRSKNKQHLPSRKPINPHHPKMGLIHRHHIISLAPTNTTISLPTTWTPAPIPPPTPTPIDDPAANSLWAEELASGNSGKLAGGIDAALGIVLIVFLSVVIYQWRAKSGKKEEEEEPARLTESTGSSSATSVREITENVEVMRDQGGKKEEGVQVVGDGK
jgi:hypothetical protein